MSRCDVTFRAMGSDVRLIIEEPGAGCPDPTHAAIEAQGFIERFEAKLSRFRPDSELCAMNADPRPRVRASTLLRDAVQGRDSRRGADRRPCRSHPGRGSWRRLDMPSSRDGVPPASLKDALTMAPQREPARPRPNQAWRRIYVDDRERVIHRPPGVAFDTGGTGKGLAADLLARRLGGYGRFVVDCGGDIRVGGFAIRARPFDIEVENPLTRERAPRRQAGHWGDSHIGPERQVVAGRRWTVRAPPARPLHRRARMDRADRRHGARRHSARGGDALQGGPALRPRGRTAFPDAQRRVSGPRQRRGRACRGRSTPAGGSRSQSHVSSPVSWG